jgi:hypothetical protein
MSPLTIFGLFAVTAMLASEASSVTFCQARSTVGLRGDGYTGPRT